MQVTVLIMPIELVRKVNLGEVHVFSHKIEKKSINLEKKHVFSLFSRWPTQWFANKIRLNGLPSSP